MSPLKLTHFVAPSSYAVITNKNASLKISSRVQTIGGAGGHQLERAGEDRDVEGHAAMEALLHEAGKHFDRVDQGAPIDIPISQ
jgi:hypothetical protein